jgi:glycosyltransferase 2 family protein
LKRVLQTVSIIVLTVFFLALFLWNSDLRQVGRIMASANGWWIAAGFAVNFFALVCRAWRWRILIGGEEPPPFYPVFFATAAGYMLSTVLPIRASDVARPALLARRSRVRFAEALGTVLTERIVDLIAILGLFVFFCIVHWNDFPQARAVIRGGAVGAGSLLVGVFLFLLGLYFFRDAVRRGHQWLGRIVPARFRGAWMRFFDGFVESLSITERPRDFFFVAGLTAAVWVCLTAQLWVVFVALGRSVPYDSTFLINAMATIGLAIPTPGGVGGFHKVCQWILETFYRFDIDNSVATAVLFHVVGTLPVLVCGVLLLFREGLRWRDVTEVASDDQP